MPTQRLRLFLVCLTVLSCGSQPVVYWNEGRTGEDGGSGGAAGAASGTGGDGIQFDDGGAAGETGTVDDAECGNGILEPGELCDDGGTEDGDGCSGDCQQQDGDYACLEPGEPCVQVVICGSGVIEGDEACDDGNETSGDGCSGDCSAVEVGWQCPRPGRDCVESPECGNGVLERGETCDDGNPISGDGCAGTEEGDDVGCRVETGYWCPQAGEDCVALVCGDGNRTADEACDDNNVSSGDGCSENCTVETGWRCSSSGCQTLCGDGLILGGEDCDDTNRTSSDGCSAACMVEPFSDCDGEPSACDSTIECGNGVIEPGEICDPPSAETGCLAGCAEFAAGTGDDAVCGNSLIESGESCDPPGAGCGTDCQALAGYTCPRPGTCMVIPVCGDGVKQVGEGCDVGAVTSAGCVDCQVTAGWTCYGLSPTVCELRTCGDGQRTSGEACDPAAPGSSEGCAGDCTVNAGWYCSSSGCFTICGDGLVVGDEECDDDNTASGDGCSAACLEEPFHACAGEPSTCDSTIECGNGAVEPGEICDPPSVVTGCLAGCASFAPDIANPPECGNSVFEQGETCDPPAAGAGCDADCLVEAGYVCPRPGVCNPIPDCGNGIREAGEDCDVGDTVSDGCAGCQITDGWNCHGLAPSVCEYWTCGDGQRTPGEGCDDGTQCSISGTDCAADSDCPVGEDCAPIGGDGCSATCTVETGWRCSIAGCKTVCGDGLVVADEEACDDDNTASGDGCSAACVEEPFYACAGEPSTCTPTISCGNGIVEPGEICDPPSTDTGCLAGCGEFAPDVTAPSTCGNALIEGDETCDPPGTGCGTDCQALTGYTCPRPGTCMVIPVCGNGVKQVGEGCDVGAVASTGCVNCQVTPGWTCYGLSPTVCELRTCGDGQRTSGEACDPAAPGSAAGCATDCTVIEGWYCSSSGCSTICGDGLVVAGEEECDDDNTASGDGCSAACLEEPFYACTGEPSTCESTIECPNGVVEPGEICEPSLDPACGADCMSFVPAAPDPPECGNSVIEAGETCDPRAVGAGCDANCLAEPGYTCPRPGVCFTTPVCGDGAQGFGEECDDGMRCSVSQTACAADTDCPPTETCGLRDADGCTDCTVDDEWLCNNTVSPSVCVHRYCGDGLRSPGEGCDDGMTCSVSGTDCDADTDCPGTETCDPRDGDGCSAICAVEAGWRCSSSGCQPICGDGIVIAGEEACDDENTDRGDGCSAVCLEEPFYDCTNLPGEPSDCDPTIECGNGVVEPGEVCDPPSEVTGCLAGCTDFDPDSTEPAVCGNGVIELGENCERTTPASLVGCNDVTCLVEPGYVCPRPGECSLQPVCGNGQREVGEACDDGSAVGADGCVGCVVTANWVCIGTSPSVCELLVCGDGARQYGEECDDHNAIDDDGCTGCTVDDGWVCPNQGEACWAICGDHLIVGSEECDYDSGATPATAGDGCNAACRLEPGWGCSVEDPDAYPMVNNACTRASCGNGGDPEPGEGCDDGNTTAGDGCGPTCQLEPTIDSGPDPAVYAPCGDGMVTGDEACDDGNDQSGDGCSGTEAADPVEHCQVEAGFNCTPQVTYPASIEFRVKYRDFYQRLYTTSPYNPYPGGHPHMKNSGRTPPSAVTDRGIPGDVCNMSNAATCGHLDTYGRPAIDTDVTTGNIAALHPTLNSYPDAFRLWYQGETAAVESITGANGTIQVADIESTLILNQTGGTESDVYYYDNTEDPANADGFWPLDHLTGDFGNTPGQSHNFHFTTELRYFFQYHGGETLTFRGDDDVFVYVNGYLAVDIGGIHQWQYGRVILGDDGRGLDGLEITDEDSNCTFAGGDLAALPGCSLVAAESEDSEAVPNEDERFGLVRGNVYEIVLFHAERHPTESNFLLTLAGFLPPRSDCSPDCGDGIVAGSEVCDDGEYDAGDPAHDQPGEYNSDTEYGACNTTCTMRTFCGDDIQQAEEACDNGRNLDLYSTGAADECAPGCDLPPRCGDGTVQTADEECDNGDGVNSNDAYGPTACRADCTYAPYCGDGVANGTLANPEACDLGSDNGVWGPTSCGYDCQAGPRCGDAVRNGPEECDYLDSADPMYEYCGDDCMIEPYCGDGELQDGEDCDYGQFNSDTAAYDGCTTVCAWSLRCGDGLTQSDYEQCDEGDGVNSDTAYGPDACTTLCLDGPRCGDGLVQSTEGEFCDNGFNADTYAYDENSCAAGCLVPTADCGDGVVEPAYESCDLGDANTADAYGSDECSTACEYGGYCGDGIPNGSELCDRGTANGQEYGDDSCSYDCQRGPYCGDLIRNGTEECDGTEHCAADCTIEGYCGDGIVSAVDDEACDYGQFASDSYGSCTDLCQWAAHCGDGTPDFPYEECDLGAAANLGGYGGCTDSCTFGPRCGDGLPQTGEGEACDNGFNDDTYQTGTPGECGVGCQPPAARCGDGILAPAYEECDNGAANDNDAYGLNACTETCTLGAFCGDGTVQMPVESCDRGALNGKEYGDGSCGYDCQAGPRCGDLIRNGAEECDGTAHCTATCTLDPYCGDGEVNLAGEECDYGQFASQAYGGCTSGCLWGPRCGDGDHDPTYEECDEGDSNDDTLYDGCTTSCVLGPRCGDAEVQDGEACDNGFNDDTYQAGVDGECGVGCEVPTSYCGDAVVDVFYEDCDLGSGPGGNSTTAYGAAQCSTSCEYGGYCGDGVTNGTEACDRGALNGQEYGPSSCGYDCQPGPTCGDGIRNGTEECDGTAHCSAACLLEAHCGDGLVALSAGEACDYGQFASDSYGSCTDECQWAAHCGDGTPDSPYEECDLGTAANLGGYGGCTDNCTLGPRCGDGLPQTDEGEACDNGFNEDTYRTGMPGECGPGCQLPPGVCGDGILEPAYEQCDNGEDNSDSAYGLDACTGSCTLGGFCGDGTTQTSAGERCDRGALNGKEHGESSCGYDCQPGPRCGDGIRNGAEECDGSEHCLDTCTLESYCGDGVVDSGEQCDYAQFASNLYGGCTTACTWGPRCGDGATDAPYEECDQDATGNNGAYDGCTATCALGPRCGDGVLQADEGERCDNGFNDDVYASSADACGPGCQLPPSCGDGALQPDFELCDQGSDNNDDAYNGCASNCLWGPYCGDGNVEAEEVCDDGANNTMYAASGTACSYDCEVAPYCGDGIRNGPEECDDGAQENVGGYGKCNSDCTRAPFCGDGNKDAGEECDAGLIGSLSCSPECKTRIVAY